jgi:hypothetical protein
MNRNHVHHSPHKNTVQKGIKVEKYNSQNGW